MANITVTDAMCCENAAMVFYEDRLMTFENWSKQIIPNKFDLAKAGFFYNSNGDEVTCFACGIRLNTWERTNVPLVEHLKWSQNCMFLKMIGYNSHDETSSISRTTGGFAFPSKSNANGLAFPSTSNVSGNAAFGFAGIPSTQRHGNF